jgi:hypothetical protein
MKQLTTEEMEEILRVHERAEGKGDVEATMATVAPDPYYEFPSFGWEVNGSDAVREHYRRSFPSAVAVNVDSKRRVHGAGPNTLFREAWVSFNTEDGERLTGLYVAVIEFDPETRKIKSERLYTDKIFDQFMAPHLGPEYGEYPGVSPLKPVIGKR